MVYDHQPGNETSTEMDALYEHDHESAELTAIDAAIVQQLLPEGFVIDDSQPRTSRYHRYPMDGPDEVDETLIVDGNFDPRANDVTDQTLQPDKTLGSYYTRWDGTTGRHGGGGDATGKAKPPKPSTSFRPIPDAEVDTGERFCVYGLSVGVREYFFNRRSEAANVLRSAAREIIEVGTTISAERMRTVGRKVDFSVRGLSTLQIAVLKIVPGAARDALTKHADSRDGQRINARNKRAA